MAIDFIRLVNQMRSRLVRRSVRLRLNARWLLLNYAESLSSLTYQGLALSIRDAQIASWLAKAVKTARMVSSNNSGVLPPRGGYFPGDSDTPSPSARFPQVEVAASWLANRVAFTPSEFAQLDKDARGVAFTVARAVTTEAVEKVRDALVRDVREGGTKDEFREAVEESVGSGILSPAMIEAIYRTQTARAMAAGQQAVLDSPIVVDEFPFVLYTAVHDSCVDPEHLMMERLGINGTAVYYADDPVIRKFWPPWRWNCRCHLVPLSVADAAKHGVREAAEWLRTGQPPLVRTYVPPPPFDLPKGWIPSGRLAAV